jgi:phosphocarrier protein HPr
MTRLSRNVTIVNDRGLHARASAKFVEKDGQSVTGTSIMGLMMLGAAKGNEITVHVQGDGAEKALEKLVGLIVDGFGED